MEGRRLYVGGLPYSTTDMQLEEIFSVHGSVESAQVIIDKFTGRSRGFGFVEMGTPDEAEAAVNALNETDLGGRTITVNEARPQRRDFGRR